MKNVFHFFTNLKIGSKMALVISGLMSCLLIGMGFISLVISSDSLDRYSNVMLLNRAQDSAAIMGAEIKGILTLVEGIAHRTQVRSGEWEQQKRVLAEELKYYPVINMLGVADAQGNYTEVGGETVNISDREYFKKALGGQGNISDPIVSRVDGNQVFAIAVPILNDQGAVRQILLALTSSDLISNYAKQIKVGETGYSYVINHSGAIIAHTGQEIKITEAGGSGLVGTTSATVNNDPAKSDGGAKTDSELQFFGEYSGKIKNGESGNGEYTYEGDHKYMAYAPVPGTNWSVIISISQAEVGKPVRTLEHFILLMIILALAVGIGVSFLIATLMIKRPINHLMHAAEEVSLGKVDVELQIKSGDELGVLGGALNKIIQATKEQAVMCKKIAHGDLTVEVVPRSEGDIMGASMKNIVHTLKELIHESVELSRAAVAGKLNTRGDADKFDGGFREIVQGVNDTLDAVILPLNIASEQLERISNGDEMAEIDPEGFSGDFKVIVINLNKVRSALNRLLEDSLMLADAAAAGRLSARADAAKHNGSYRRIVEGVNQTLDGVIMPINESATVLEELSRGNLDVSVQGEYQGDFAVIKHALNHTVSSLRRYILEISQALGAISRGNLNIRLEGIYLGEFDQIKKSLNHTIDAFNSILVEMNTASEQVDIGARQVAQGSQVLSQGATEQASSIEELTASIAEIAATTKNNALRSAQANDLTGAAMENAVTGNDQMKKMLDSMADINTASKSISKIIKVIDEIAFQTNILALNASVESARAGQHGKGFAVVAEEVRNLASRSATAAQETAALIESSIQKIQSGAKIANNTAKAFGQIVDGVEKATVLVGEIAAASNEQAVGIDQINKAVGQVSWVVQSNSATAEQSAAASEELSSQAGLLKEMVARFELRNDLDDKAGRISEQDDKSLAAAWNETGWDQEPLRELTAG